MDSALPALPAAAPVAGALPIQPQPQLQPQQARPPGRPAEDPQRQEERTARHAERKRVEGVLPQRALDSKLLVFRKDGQRIRPGTRPVLTILVSELERARADDNLDAETYICDRIAEKLGDRADGTYEVQTVDRRGTRLSDIPAFDITIGPDQGDEGDEGDDGDGDDDGPLDGDMLAQLRQQLQPGAGAIFPPGQQPQGAPLGPPPAAQQLDMRTVDELGRRNRGEAEEKSNQTLAMVIQMMVAQQQNSQAQAQQQTQILIEAMRQNAPKPPDNSLVVGLVTALAPILAKILEPKPPQADPTMTLVLTEMLKRERNDPAGAMLKEIPAIMGEVTRQQMALQATGAQQAVAVSNELNKTLMSGLIEQVKEARAASKGGGEEGGSTMESVAKIAAAVLPGLMGRGAAAAEEPVAALPAPQPQARPAPRAKAPPPAPTAQPEAAQPQPQPPVQRRTPETRIRSCLTLIADLHAGKVPAERYADALAYVANAAPTNVRQAIMAESMPEILSACTAAVVESPRLLQWIADPDHQGFLTEFLRDVRRGIRTELTEATVAQRIAGLQAMQEARRGAPTQPAPAAAPAAPTQPAAPAPAAQPGEPAAEATPGAPAAEAQPGT